MKLLPHRSWRVEGPVSVRYLSTGFASSPLARFTILRPFRATRAATLTTRRRRDYQISLHNCVSNRQMFYLGQVAFMRT